MVKSTKTGKFSAKSDKSKLVTTHAQASPAANGDAARQTLRVVPSLPIPPQVTVEQMPVMLGCQVTPNTAEALHQFRHKLSRKLGVRVTKKSLIQEALADLFVKYGEPVPADLENPYI